MRPRQKYIRLSEGPILVTQKQKTFVDDIVSKRGSTINQTIRDIIDHAMECPFFSPNFLTNGNISPERGE